MYFPDLSEFIRDICIVVPYFSTTWAVICDTLTSCLTSPIDTITLDGLSDFNRNSSSHHWMVAISKGWATGCNVCWLEEDMLTNMPFGSCASLKFKSGNDIVIYVLMTGGGGGSSCACIIKSNNHYTPAQRSWRGGILDSPCPSVRDCIIGRSIAMLEDEWTINGIIRRSAVLKTINWMRWKLPIKENNCKKMTT